MDPRERTPSERIAIIVEGVKMARKNARNHRTIGDEAKAKAAFARAYDYIDIARMFKRIAS